MRAHRVADGNSAGNVKPNLFIVGAPKCGTSAWVHYLRSHPDICFSTMKEPHFFCADHNWRFIENEQDYLKLFEHCGSAKIVAEASVRYLYSTVAPASIRKFNPDAKIIVFVREQEHFVPSWHNQMLYREQERIEEFEEAWRLSGKRDKSNIGPAREPKFLDYKALGRFSDNVERCFAVFPPEQIRVFHFRDWSRDPRQTYLEILRFLGLPDDGRTDFPKINEAKHQRSRVLARLLVNPPGPAKRLGRLLRKIFGKPLDRVVALALKLNRRQGYLSEVSEELRQEIRAYYEADNALLEPRIWKPDKPRQQAQAER